MATKDITPTNPDTNATDEAGDESANDAERKTMNFKWGRKSARKTASGSCRF